MRPSARRNLQLLAIAAVLALAYFLAAPVVLQYGVGDRSLRGVIRLSPIAQAPPRAPAIPEGVLCVVAAAPTGSFELRMDTQLDYCYTLVPPAEATTNLVWETTEEGTQVNVAIHAVCSAAAGCFDSIESNIPVYDQTSSFGTAQFSNPMGLAFTVGVWNPTSCGSTTTGGSCGNETVLISGAWA
jgi:hypothetical protein